MPTKISPNYMFYICAGDIWDKLLDTYSMRQDIYTCYDLDGQIFNVKQGALFIANYYRILKGLWIKLE